MQAGISSPLMGEDAGGGGWGSFEALAGQTCPTCPPHLSSSPAKGGGMAFAGGRVEYASVPQARKHEKRKSAAGGRRGPPADQETQQQLRKKAMGSVIPWGR